MTSPKIITCLSDIVIKEDEYINADGMICCKVCQKPRYAIYNMYGKDFTFREDCDCQLKENAQKELDEKIEREKQRLLDRQLRIQRLKSISLLDKKFKGVSFEKTENTSESFKTALTTCKNYCNSFECDIDNGYGLYIFGGCGVGKSHLTACMANELMEKHLCTVVYTNFGEIDKRVKANFCDYGDSEFIQLLTNVDFLFIDDLGTERIVNGNGQDLMLQQTIYDIINGRYLKCKPLVITSNFSLKDLIKKTGILDKTVDRIYEMATKIIEVQGNSYRQR